MQGEQSLCQWYDHVWLVDFEYREPEGGFPEIRCMVVREFFSGDTHRYWADELATMKQPPFDIGERSLVVAYYAPAELKCFRQLGWPMPKRILDLFVEFRATHNGCRVRHGYSLLGALLHYGLPAMLAEEKQSLRELAMANRRSHSYSREERKMLIDYCEADVVALHHLLRAMDIDPSGFTQPLFRGRYMAAVAKMETVGVPVDVDLFRRVENSWDRIREVLIEKYDARFGIFQQGHWSFERFEQYLIRVDIPWPRTESGRLSADDTTFRNMARQYPEVAELRALLEALGQMRLFAELAIGPDGRNRTSLSPFRSKTGRNQPSNARSIFGPSVWVRSFIRPEPGKALVYLDWSQQEFLIAAALSDDQAMLDAYDSGDVYMAVAIMCGKAPAGATKKTHPQERELFKQVVLANNYGQGARGMAERIGSTLPEAQHLQWLFKMAFRRYFAWSETVLNTTTLSGLYWTPFGWPLHVDEDAVNGRSIKNFPVQGAGSDMLRAAVCLATEAGIQVCISVHDALLVEANVNEIDAVIEETSRIMDLASEAVCGRRCRNQAQKFCYPDRFLDKDRGLRFFRTVLEIMNEKAVLTDLQRQIERDK